MTRLIHRIGLFALATFLLAPAVLAQGNQGQPAPAPDIEVSDDELTTFANAFLEVRALEMQYRPKIQQAENQEEARTLTVELQQEASKRIEDTEGITPQRFGTIMRAARSDQGLRSRLESAIQSAQQDSTATGGN